MQFTQLKANTTSALERKKGIKVKQSIAPRESERDIIKQEAKEIQRKNPNMNTKTAVMRTAAVMVGKAQEVRNMPSDENS